MSLILDGTNGLSDIDGSAATPAIRGTDTNTGIFFPAADTIAFTEGGAESMRITSAGNVGVGTTSPSDFGAGFRMLAVSGSSTGILQTINSTDSVTTEMESESSRGAIGTRTNHPLVFKTNQTERARITSDGNVGIGTSSPEANAKLTVKGAGIAVSKDSSTVTPSGFDLKCRSSNPQIGLHVTGTAQLAQIEFGTAGDNSFGALINVTGADPLRFGTNNTERARIDSSGNLLVGATGLTQNASYMGFSPANGFADFGHINGSSSGLEYIKFLYNATKIGSITQNGTTAVAYNTSSDYRLKNTIAPMTGALAKVALLKPVTYKWNVDGSDGQGFIAHELAEVIPDCVTGAKDAVDEEGNPQYQGIDTSFLVATLTAAIQEQQALIQSLKARLDAANL
jgi:hypothetical protein